MFNPATASYEEAFAHFAPIFRDMWKTRSVAACAAAKRDIVETLPLHQERNAYVGKLYAELDAIRDREAAMNPKPRCASCGEPQPRDQSCGCFDNHCQ